MVRSWRGRICPLVAAPLMECRKKILDGLLFRLEVAAQDVLGLGAPGGRPPHTP